MFDKLDAFLPQMQHANEELQQKIALDGAEKYSLDLQDSVREIESGLCDTESKPTVEMVLHNRYFFSRYLYQT